MKVLKVISCKYVGAKSPILRQTPTVRRQCDPVSPETRDGGARLLDDSKAIRYCFVASCSCTGQRNFLRTPSAVVKES